ncbi:hypothetical protein LINPERHAP1_LOCUS10346 [Linum perenne]
MWRFTMILLVSSNLSQRKPAEQPSTCYHRW